MRFSWNEENLLRDKILLEISEKYFEKQKKFVPVELKHSKEVLKVFLEDDSKNIINQCNWCFSNFTLIRLPYTRISGSE